MLSLTTLARILAVAGAAAAAAGRDRLVVRADDYTWKVTWTGPETCSEMPCPYSYDISGPRYASASGSVPSFAATCSGSVDEPAATCELVAHEGASEPAVAGNFSTYETSGVGAGQVVVAVTWFEEKYNRDLTLTGVSPLQASDENQGTWDVYPVGCPLADCPGSANATAPASKPRRRLAAWWEIGRKRH